MDVQTRVTDRALAAAVVRRDAAALEELYRRYSPMCIAVATRMVFRPHRAEEIVQDVFLRFWKSANRYDSARGSVQTFLCAATRHAAIDVLRAERTSAVRDERYGFDARPNVDALDETFRRHDCAAVRDALLTLDECERLPITLAYFGGYSYRDVARVLGLPEGTVKTRIRMGMRRMHQALKARVAA